MAPIPPEVALLTSGRTPESKGFRQILLALVLNSEEEEVVLTRRDLEASWQYALKVTAIEDGKDSGIVLTAVRR